jgi:hypothetical protein
MSLPRVVVIEVVLMVVSDLSSIAAGLRQEGYEARNLGQVGITVYKDGRGIYLPAEELRRLNGNVSLEVAALFAAQRERPGYR